MKKAKKVLAILTATAMVFGLTACGESAGTTQAESEGVSTNVETEKTTQASESADTTADSGQYDIESMTFEEGTTVKFYCRMNPDGGDPESEYFIEQVKKWNEEKRYGITIEPLFISVEGDYYDRLSTDIASGDAPDVFMQYGGSNCLDYVESGILLKLNPYLDYDKDWYNGIVSANWGPTEFSKFGYEGIYGVPWSAYEILLYYNEEYLTACNLEVPKSWDDLMNCSKVLQEKGYQPFMWGNGGYKLGHMLSVIAAKSYGADFQDELATRSYTYESKEILDAIQKIKDMLDAGYLGENILSFDANAERTYFGNGEAAFMVDLSRGGAVLSNSESYKKGTIHATKFPYIKEEFANVSMGGASSAFFVCTMDKSEEQVNASLKVLRWLTSTEYVDGIVKNYANTYSVIPSEKIIDNYLFEECNSLMRETEIYVGELAEASTNAAERTIVRSALELLSSGSLPEKIGKEIMKNLSEYE